MIYNTLNVEQMRRRVVTSLQGGPKGKEALMEDTGLSNRQVGKILAWLNYSNDVTFEDGVYTLRFRKERRIA